MLHAEGDDTEDASLRSVRLSADGPRRLERFRWYGSAGRIAARAPQWWGHAVTYLASWFLRRAGRRRAGIAASTAGYLTALVSAYLGGEPVFAKGAGVNHTAFEPGSDAYVAVMKSKDLVEGKLTRVDVAGMPAVLFKQGNTIYAIGATCTHQRGPFDGRKC